MTTLNSAMVTFFDADGNICAEENFTLSYFAGCFDVVRDAAVDWANDQMDEFDAEDFIIS